MDTTINKISFVENQVRANNPEIKELGNNYIKSQSNKNKQYNKQKTKQETEKDIFIRRRNQYISCLNLGRIKKIKTDILYKYGIVYNIASGKYESVKINSKNEYFNITKIIADNSHLWTDTFNPETILKNAIASIP